MYVYSKFNNKTCICLTLLWSLCASNVAWAIDLLEGRLQIHGFIAQGLVNTSDNNFLGETDDSISYDFREIGLNASYRALPQLLFSGQLMSHTAGESDHGEPDIDFAFMDWTALSGEQGRAGIRLGRVKNPYGLYNATRDVPFTRPSILLPQSMYFERARKISVSSDGANFYADYLSAWGTLSAEIVLGFPPIDKASEIALLGNNIKGHFESKFSQLYQVRYESPSAQYVFAATVLNLKEGYQPAVGPDLASGNFYFDPVILSAQYNAEKWSLTSEYAFRNISYKGFGPGLPDFSKDAESYYVQGTYKILPKLEMVLRYDAAFNDRNDRNGKDFFIDSKGTKGPNFTQYTKDWTLGLRYDVTPAFMLRAEYHNIEGTSILPGMDNPAGPNAHVKNWDMWMLLGSYYF